MTKLLEKAIKEVSSLPTEEQDALAAILLQELGDEELWSKAFTASPEKLARLADEALTEHHRSIP